MTPVEANHRKLSEIRIPAFARLFGGKPNAAFPYHQFNLPDDGPFMIDVLVYPLAVEEADEPVVAAVTNGMSDQRMVEGDHPEQPRRREVIQYLHDCTFDHAKRLRDMAWLPLYSGFLLETRHSIAWEFSALAGTPWKHAFFLEPPAPSHRAFSVEIEGDAMSLLWHIPISDEERNYKIEHGANALLDRMDEVKLPWIFDERNRPPLL